MSCCLKPVTPKIHWDFKPQISSIHIDIFEAPFSNQLLRLGAAEALRQAVAYSRKQSMKRQEAREVKRKKLVILPRSWQNSFPASIGWELVGSFYMSWIHIHESKYQLSHS